MAPPPWTTPPQAQFLEGKKAAFLQAQTAGQQTRFFAGLYEEWFSLWPVRESLFPTPEGQLSQPLMPAQNQEVQTAVTNTKSVSTTETPVLRSSDLTLIFISAFKDVA
jgi:hypothetical protein